MSAGPQVPEEKLVPDPDLMRAVGAFLTAPCGIVVSSRKGIILSANPFAEQLFGYVEGGMLGRHVRTLIPARHLPGYRRRIMHWLQESESRQEDFHQDLVGLRQDGSQVELHVIVWPIKTPRGGHYHIGFVNDISARKQEEIEARARLFELAHINRLGAINEIAAGLAHEIHQPLAAIRVTTEACRSLLRNHPVDSSLIEESLEQVGLQVERANDVIEQLRRFIRKGTPDERQLCDADHLVRGVLALLSHELNSHSIRVEVALHQPLCHCLINPVQIEQVLFNLIRNAIEAMASMAGERRLYISSQLTADGEQCEILIRDSGPGIQEEDFDKLFHPFFTTREQGLGQGLPICRSILRGYGSDLQVRNHPGGGAEFSFRLPTTSETGQRVCQDTKAL